MVDDTNLTLGKRLTFSAAMSLSWLALSASLKVALAFLAGWLTGGAIVSSIATVQKNGSGDIASVKRLEMTFSNVTITWEKRHVT
jgi:hypothetical protein